MPRYIEFLFKLALVVHFTFALHADQNEKDDLIESDSEKNTSQQLIFNMCTGIPECLLQYEDASGKTRMQWSNVTYTPDQFEPCCLPCDCTSNCLVKGNCCLVKNSDIPPQYHGHGDYRYVNDLGEICLPTTYGANGYNQYDLDLAHLAVHHCPDSYDGPLKSLCINRNVSDVESMTPVYSNRLGLNFANIYCAQCNGEYSDLVPWDMSFVCHNASLTARTLIDGFPEPLLPGLGEYCKVIWNPAKPDTASPCKRYGEEIVATCSDTRGPPPTLADLCSSWTAPLRSDQTIFGNVYCRNCHEAKGGCPFYFSTKRPFTLLLNYRGQEAETIEAATNLIKTVCPSGLTFIPELNECLAVSCPISSIRMTNRCFSLLAGAKDVTLDYSVLIEYNPREVNNTGDSIYTMMEPLVGTSAGNICSRVIGQEVKIGNRMMERIVHAYVNVVKPTNINMEFDMFAKRLHLQNNTYKHFNMHINWKKAHVQVGGPGDFLQFQGSIPNSNYCPKTIVAMTEKQFCNTVHFSEFSYIGNNGKIKLDKTELLPGDFVLRTLGHKSLVITCLSTYASRVLGRPVHVDIPWLKPPTDLGSQMAVSLSSSLFAIIILAVTTDTISSL